MVPIEAEKVQKKLDELANQDIFLHLETTNGAYSARKFGAYIRNGLIHYSRGTIKGEDGAYRVGLKTEHGWIYGEWLTDWETDDKGRLLLAGHDEEGRLAVAFQLSKEPF
ncbi:MAG TPA: YojF family protein [Bacillales bacterium]|nr:YojF family protein [Bacillales bacterium]